MRTIIPVSDLAVMLNISPWATTKLIRLGRIPAEKVGRTWFIQRADAEAFAASYVKRERETTRAARRAASTETTDGAL